MGKEGSSGPETAGSDRGRRLWWPLRRQELPWCTCSVSPMIRRSSLAATWCTWNMRDVHCQAWLRGYAVGRPCGAADPAVVAGRPIHATLLLR
jgi:hypothetical protein